ncbi:MAG: hypothetical protein AAFR84_22815, partial [Pseudomonadota bacterium]
MSFIRTALAVGAIALAAVPAAGETRVTYKSAKSASSYFQMAVQIAEAMKAGTDGDVIVTGAHFHDVLDRTLALLDRHDHVAIGARL